jgi:hypothetical protein
MRAFRAQHGEGAVDEALQLIEQRGRVTAEHWDERGHARAVKVGLMKAVNDHRQIQEEDPLGSGNVPSIRTGDYAPNMLLTMRAPALRVM